MSVEIDRGRLVDTVSGSVFGPLLRNDDEGLTLIAYVQRVHNRDVRELSAVNLQACLNRIRLGVADSDPTHPERRCLCGSGEQWLSKSIQLGHPTTTRCARCS